MAGDHADSLTRVEILFGILFGIGLLCYGALFLLIGAMQWLWETLVVNALLFGVLGAIAAILSTALFFILARGLPRAKRTWLQVLRWLLIIFAGVVSLTLIGLTILAFAVAAWVNSFG